MSDISHRGDFDLAAELFLDQLRAGKRPSISEYIRRFPDLSDEILDLFPALVAMEKLKQDQSGSTVPHSPRESAPAGAGVPERLGDYRITRVIGAGGMGVVYEARRESLQAPVALKVLHHGGRGDRNYRRRFQNEARSAARLHHSNIVPVFDFGEHDGVLYYVMQYIPGQALDAVLDHVRRVRGGLPATPGEVATTLIAESGEASEPAPARPDSTHPGSLASADQPTYHREVARIGAEVAWAIAYAHDRGVLHRDLKPSNLLVDDRGNPWITDFGLAKYEGGDDLTATGDIVGTVRYMAPERFEGRSDAQCDIYALGMTLYEMLALRPAYEGRSRHELIRRILESAPTPLRKVDPRISRDLETVVHKAIARSPSDRYATATELAEELRRVAENRPIRSRRIPPHEQLWRWCRRNPLIAGLATSAAAMTLLIAILSTVAFFWIKRANNEIRENLRRAEIAEHQRSERLWDARLAQARAVRFGRRSGQRFDALAAIAEAARIGRELGHPPERFNLLRNEAIAALALPDIQITTEFGRWTDDVASVDLDENFQLYATSDVRGGGIVRRVADDVEIIRLPDSPDQRRLAFGPGRWLADHHSPGTRHLTIWDIGGPTPIARIDVRRPVLSWDFRPDGRLVTLLHQDGSLATHDLRSGKLRVQLPPRTIPTEPILRKHPTAPFVAITSYFSKGFEIRQVETGETLSGEIPWPDGRTYPGDWSADGRQLAIPVPSAVKAAIYEFAERPPTLKLLRTVDLLDSTSTIAFNKEGDRLFGRGWGAVTFMQDANTGRNLFATKAFNFPLVSWDARVLRTDRGRTRLFPGMVNDKGRRFAYWSVAEGRECRLIVHSAPRQIRRWSSLSPDDRLGLGVSTGQVALVDLATGREVGSLPLKDPMPGLYAGFDQSGHLYTQSKEGCYRWPISSSPDAPDVVEIGPPLRLPLDPDYNIAATSRDGRIVAQSAWRPGAVGPESGALLMNLDRHKTPRQLARGVSLGNTTVSPDRRWVAFEGQPGSILVYEVETEEKVWEATSQIGRCLFTPDGKWLATGTDNGRLYAAGTWKPGPQLGPGYLACFSSDGELAVLSGGAGPFRLVEVATGRELARFEDPDQDVEQVSMSADKATLLTTHKKGLLVWDLRRIRAELARMGLDWDAPALAPAPPVVPVRSVRFLGAESIGR
ncbi:MAG: hypothetical protein ABS79_02625 [Planctomycetes bacterium SCN 63-9]|nr:MAG: hypothetical protein ABS79_02625 [Planctomycetes bacterium SCN 63-9]